MQTNIDHVENESVTHTHASGHVENEKAEGGGSKALGGPRRWVEGAQFTHGEAQRCNLAFCKYSNL